MNALGRKALASALVFTLMMAGVPAMAQQGTGGEATEAAEAIRQLIAALNVDEASKKLTAFKADHKGDDAKKIAKELSAEIAKAKKLKPAVQQIEKLAKAMKHREAYAHGMATMASFPRALGLAAVKKVTNEARDKAYVVLGDFDEPELDPAWGASHGTAQRTTDPCGGGAVHWVPEAGSAQAGLYKQFSEPLDVTPLEYVTIRIKASKLPTGQLSIRLINTDASKDYIHGLVPMKGTTGWQELTAKISGLEKSSYGGTFDPKYVVAFTVMYRGVDNAEFDVDDVMIARR